MLVGNPQYLRNIRNIISRHDTEHLLAEFMDADDAPSQNDKMPLWQSVRDAKLSAVLNKTEFLIVRFYQQWHLTLWLGQLLSEMLRHPEFDTMEVCTTSFVSLH